MGNSSTQSSPVDVGTVIADTYTIEALIGRGGMGAVFLASHKRLPGKKVAIKVLHTDADDEEILLRFKREAEIASRLGHPNIVGVSDYNITPEGMPYLVLEYLEGESLAQRIKAGPIPIEQVMSIARQIASALSAAHREGIVHRDLKPQNIFLCPTMLDGRQVEIAKVLDFGISKIRGSETVKTQDNSLLGTPQYMAPEQATGQHTQVDERTDIFALGAIVYEMLAGHPAFSGASIPEVVFKVVYEQPKPLLEEAPGTPDNVIGAVARAMAKPADDRFPNVNEFVESLTGSPLSTYRSHAAIPVPDAGFASGSRLSKKAPKVGEDAFAHTVGSGQHDVVPISGSKAASTIGTDATVAPISSRSRREAANVADEQPVDVGARTMAESIPPDTNSKSDAAAPMGTIAKRVPPEAAKPVEPTAPSSKKPVALMAGLAVVCVGAAIVAIVFATRGGKQRKTRVDAAGIAMVAPVDAALPIADAPVAIASIDAVAIASTLDAAAPIDAAPVKATPDAAVRILPRPDAAPVEVGDPVSEATLKTAEALLATGQYKSAGETARGVAIGEGATAEQRRHANAIVAIGLCAEHEEARARDLLRTVGKWRAKGLAGCKKQGTTIEDN